MMQENYSLSSAMLDDADLYHNDLVGGYDEVSSYLDKRTGGTIIKFPHFNGPQGRGAMFGKETSDQIDSSKAKAFRDSIERAVYKASPLPSAPDDAVFSRELLLKFRVN